MMSMEPTITIRSTVVGVTAENINEHFHLGPFLRRKQKSDFGLWSSYLKWWSNVKDTLNKQLGCLHTLQLRYLNTFSSGIVVIRYCKNISAKYHVEYGKYNNTSSSMRITCSCVRSSLLWLALGYLLSCVVILLIITLACRCLRQRGWNWLPGSIYQVYKEKYRCGLRPSGRPKNIDYQS